MKKKSLKSKKKQEIDNLPNLMDFVNADDTGQDVREILRKRMQEESKILKEKKIREKEEAKIRARKLTEQEFVYGELIRVEKIHIGYNERIAELCRHSNDLVIDASKIIRKRFFGNEKDKLEYYKKTGQKLKCEYIGYSELDKMLQGTECYGKLGVCAQQTLIGYINEWTSYWEGIKEYSKVKGNKSGIVKSSKEDRKKFAGIPKIPHKRNLGGQYILWFSNQQCYIKTERNLDGNVVSWMVFPDWMNLQFNYPNGVLNRIKTRLDSSTNLREVRIVPKGIGYDIEIVYKIEKEVRNKFKIPERVEGLDFGIRNFITIGSNVVDVEPYAIKSGAILSANYKYYKKRKKIQRKYQSQCIRSGHALRELNTKHDMQIIDILHKDSRYVVDRMVENNVDTIFVGYNQEWKQSVGLGKRTNQKFYGLPHYKFLEQLQYKAIEKKIQVIEQEESHTSKCDFLANEDVCHHSKYLGKREGAMFKSSTGKAIHADVQGAYNDIKKGTLRLYNEGKIKMEDRNAILKAFPKGKVDEIVGVRLHPVRTNPLRPRESGMRDLIRVSERYSGQDISGCNLTNK